ncbi:PucR family transcriptional regulator [Acetobacterium tundrae]|uniref:PucR C-terminal helix-turn-helix domain-containing protein n=1 Tax=Acetobacterium tundrae TaxID=132932 RepID=A0ABR6WJ38_9FIRM|nr:PucR family transcriptional regulator [Acetobacterium tundrae]MBC3796167.1 hypothetical protein [Acetobacterium tundrae]
MQISPELIIKGLKNEFQDFTLLYSEKTDFSTMKLSGICSIDTETVIRNGTLYLMDPGCDLLVNADIIQGLEKSDAVICALNRMADEFEQHCISYICFIKNTVSGDDSNFLGHHFYNRVFHSIYDIFQQYQTWQQNLYLAVENDDIQEMMDYSVPIFGKSIYVANKNQEYLAAAGPCLDYSGSGSQVPLETFNYLKNEDYIKPSFNKQEPFLYPAGILNSDALCRDIFVNGDFFCRIIIIDELGNESFSPGDYELIKILCNALQLLINQNYQTATEDKGNSEKSSSLISLFNQIISDERVEKSQLDSALLRNGWLKDEGCYIGYLLLYPSNIQDKSTFYYCRYIEKKFVGVYSIDRNDHLILIIQESIYPSLDKFFAEFILFIRDCNFRFGVSNLCSNFMQLSFYYLQAEIAVNQGIQRNETIWCHKFADYALNYLLQEACHKMPAELLCAPELTVLKNYDRRKKTDYYLTLKTYLDNHRNATQTAKELYIHKATMVYRLKRLKELTGIDYDDKDKMLYLHLSCKILEID